MHALHTITDTLERNIDLAIATGIRRRSNRRIDRISGQHTLTTVQVNNLSHHTFLKQIDKRYNHDRAVK